MVLFRRRSEAMKDFSIPFPGPPSLGITSAARASNLACFLWACIAFLLGVMVGVSLPLLTKYTVENISEANPLSERPYSQLPSKWGTLASPPTMSPYGTEVSSFSWPTSLYQTPEEEESLSVPVSVKDDNGNVFAGSSTSDSDNIYSRNTISNDDSNSSTISSIISPDDETTGNRNMILEDKVFFGPAVEAAMPPGFSEEDVEEWRRFVRREAVVRLEEGCGRMQNRLLTFSNGSQSCCRYRQNLDQIQGEIFSFYLSRLLGIRNVPPSALGVVKASAWQWSGIGNQLALAQWAEERPVVLTKFVNNLQSVSIPHQLRSSSRRLHPLDVERLQGSPSMMSGLVELAQWSDLLVFDYLTANLDRVVNNLYNLQWNPSMMDAPAHNLAQQTDSKFLVFLDNESGLLHGYRLLDKYEPFHESLLQSLCVFRRSTADHIRQLVTKREAGPKLLKMFRNYEPDLQDYLPSIPEKSIKVLNERLKRVHKQIKKCENLYMNS